MLPSHGREASSILVSRSELMTEEKQPISEQEARKEAWLKRLASFIVIANGKTWAGDGAEVSPRRPGYKRLQWPYPEDKMTDKDKKDYESWEDWRLEDEYTGYFKGPGATTVYFKNRPVWVMSYGGPGLTKGYEAGVERTYEFLRAALRQVTSELPFRGPRIYVDGNKRYEFEIEGGLENSSWKERTMEDDVQTFAQTGQSDIVVGKDSNRQPVYPWDL